VSERHGWVAENIVERLEPVGKLKTNIEIFEYETCERLMAASLANTLHERVVAPLALGMFVGMRPEEISHPNFGWQMIDLENSQIKVPAEVAKDGDQRTVTLQPVAVAWLKLARKLRNPLPPINQRKLINSCCEMAGITHWPHDVLRKTCATHLRNHYENDWHVVKDLGNSIRILLKHYADLKVPASVSKQHWKLTPDLAAASLKELVKRQPPATSA
jgi:integrase